MKEELITALELSDKMKVGKQTITNWGKDGCPCETRLPHRFLWSDVKDWLRKRER